MKNILEAILNDAPAAEFASIEIPESYEAVTVHKDDVDMFAGRSTREKDPRESLHLDQVPVPELGPGEAIVAVMASSINYNTVWTSIFEPVPTFGFLERYGRTHELAKRHDLPYHIIGSDLAGVVLRTGPGVNAWHPGDEVVAHCLSVELENPAGHNDTMMDPEQRIWGFETNFGGLAEIALVKSNQLMPKPKHLTWEEAAAPGLVNSTAYRQLVSRNGAGMKQGDVVLIWGASGGLGSYATQYALNGGAIPVCVVSSPEKAEICRKMGAEYIIDRNEENYQFWKDEHTQNPKEWQRLGKKIRELTGGEDVDIVYEHPGRETFGASVYVAKKGGTIVTCASTSGYMHEYDNRYLWMNLKRIIGSHFANYKESYEANRLIDKGMIHPTLSKTFPLAQTGQAAFEVHRNQHQGKVGVLCLAPEEGLGVSDPEKRAQFETEINRFPEHLMFDDNARTLLDKPRQFATISTIEPDGQPQSSVVWFERDGDDLLISTVEGRRKHRNLVRDPRCTVLVYDMDQPYAYVEVRGHVEMTQEGGRELIDKFARAYQGWDRYPADDGTDNVRVVVRVVADKVVSRAIPAKKD